MKQLDKAGTFYWNENWTKVDFPKLFDHTDQSLDNYVNLELHHYFKKVMRDRKEIKVLEIGCANSIWPIYFYQYYRAQVYGVDYSEVGCEKSRALLKHYNIPGSIVCADLFSPPSSLLNSFDLVVSFGVVEHFENTADCLKACAAFVKPEGQLLTLIPNIPSVVGFIQKHVDRKVYDVHVPLTKGKLALMHRNAGLDLQSCDYFMSMNLSVINSGNFSQHPLNKGFRHLLSGFSKIFWMLERFGIRIPRNKFTSPYIIALTKPRKAA